MDDRLTNRTHDGNAYLVNVKDDEQEVECKSENTAQCILDSWERLAAYEDLGPVEEFAALKERTRWIPVSERLPEKDGFYNVVMNGGVWGEPDVWSATSCGFYDGMWDEDGTTITHWMLLPEAPKESDNAK